MKRLIGGLLIVGLMAPIALAEDATSQPANDEGKSYSKEYSGKKCNRGDWDKSKKSGKWNCKTAKKSSWKHKQAKSLERTIKLDFAVPMGDKIETYSILAATNKYKVEMEWESGKTGERVEFDIRGSLEILEGSKVLLTYQTELEYENEKTEEGGSVSAKGSANLTLGGKMVLVVMGDHSVSVTAAEVK